MSQRSIEKSNSNKPVTFGIKSSQMLRNSMSGGREVVWFSKYPMLVCVLKANISCVKEFKKLMFFLLLNN